LLTVVVGITDKNKMGMFVRSRQSWRWPGGGKTE
jgi:hypothetical protein